MIGSNQFFYLCYDKHRSRVTSEVPVRNYLNKFIIDKLHHWSSVYVVVAMYDGSCPLRGILFRDDRLVHFVEEHFMRGQFVSDTFTLSKLARNKKMMRLLGITQV